MQAEKARELAAAIEASEAASADLKAGRETEEGDEQMAQLGQAFVEANRKANEALTELENVCKVEDQPTPPTEPEPASEEPCDDKPFAVGDEVCIAEAHGSGSGVVQEYGDLNEGSVLCVKLSTDAKLGDQEFKEGDQIAVKADQLVGTSAESASE